MGDDRMPLDVTGASGVSAKAEHGRRQWRDPCGSRSGWLILQTKYGQDRRCFEALTAPVRPTHRHWDARFLQVWERRTHRDRHGDRVRTRRMLVPMFPGYLFVLVAPGAEWGALRSVPGSAGVLMRLDDPDAPCLISHEQLADAEALAVSRQEALDAEDRPPGRGDRLGWRGLEGVCLWTKGDRVRMLMRMLGRDSEVTLPLAAVKLIQRADD